MASLVRVLCVLAVVGGVARAEDKDKARELFRQAQSHYKLGEFQPALDGFKEAYRNFEEPSLLFNIAQCERQLGHKQEALRSFRMFLSEVSDAPNRAEVEKLIATLERAIKDDAAAQPPQNTLPPAEHAAPAPSPAMPPPAIERRKHTWWMVGLGAGLLAAGAAGIGTGAGALAVDGHGSCSLATGQVRCPQTYNTGAEGGALFGAGLASAVAGALLVIVEERRYHSALRADLGVSSSGATLVVSGGF